MIKKVSSTSSYFHQKSCKSSPRKSISRVNDLISARSDSASARSDSVRFDSVSVSARSDSVSARSDSVSARFDSVSVNTVSTTHTIPAKCTWFKWNSQIFMILIVLCIPIIRGII